MAEEKVNAIELTDGETNTHYILDFTRDTVVFAEDRGFDWDQIGTKPGTMIPLIWWTSFRRYHPAVSRDQSLKILEAMGGMTQEIMVRLRELYDQSLSSLINTEDSPKNGKWTVGL